MFKLLNSTALNMIVFYFTVIGTFILGLRDLFLGLGDAPVS